jgi:hypothetical protein
MTPEQIIERAAAQMRATAALLRTHPGFNTTDSILASMLVESVGELETFADSLEYVGIA